ncbi:MAG: hypothetical protein C0457_02690 [Polymorphum sp.]|nr:hypothetical protein [Polymorphum sp.]
MLASITISFSNSAQQNWFNGVPASRLLNIECDERELRSHIAALVKDHFVTCVFACVEVNMHIKRFPDIEIAKQLELIETESLQSFCIYPKSDVILSMTDVSHWNDRPYSRELALAEPQLSFRAFDMAALERYVNDPQYKVDFSDYIGTMSIGNKKFSDENYPKRDKVGLQTFGLGFSADKTPFVVVFLRYLADLSPEHQQAWRSYETHEDVFMSEQYYQSSIEGIFWKNRSIRYAILKEIDLIDILFKAIWGQSLFRKRPSNDVPIGLTSFLRPTAHNYDRFVMSMDKLLSENIDIRFFDGKLPREKEIKRENGEIIVQKKGSLALLEEWLLSQIEWEDEESFRNVVIEPLRRVRRERQKPAHEFVDDEHSPDYRKNRKKILWDVFNSLSNIRSTLASHPLAKDIEIPAWLDGENFDVF